jgi:hypothetical protein
VFSKILVSDCSAPKLAKSTPLVLYLINQNPAIIFLSDPNMSAFGLP